MVVGTGMDSVHCGRALKTKKQAISKYLMIFKNTDLLK
jgi:hypothetical protein